jgi:hypothetical protein
MFNRPNSQDPASIVADFLELQCLLTNAPVSTYSLRSLFSISDDEIDNEGIVSSDDFSIDALEDGIKECEQRASFCPSKYPFNVSSNSLIPQIHEDVNKEIYQFLLLSTRLNMNTQSEQAGFDATDLFEELSSKVAAEYFGQHSKSMVFGTAETGTFKQKIERVINNLNLTSLFKTPLGSTGRQKDAAVDVVAWIPFADKKDSQLIAIGQCKTGTHWEGMLTSTQPKVFFESYFTGAPFADVERMFFVSESYGIDRWEERTRKAGIMFDRTRIMEYIPSDLDVDLLYKITQWNQAAMVCAEQNM